MENKIVRKMNNERSSPEMSIIVAVVSPPDSLSKCLDSVLANENQNSIEILSAGQFSNAQLSDLIKKYPTVSFLQFPETAELPELLAGAISRSSGEIIAITDSACVVASDWISAVFKAHQGKELIVGGAVEISGEEFKKPLDWAAFFCDYAMFMSPLENGVARSLPGNNISFKREALYIGKQFVRDEFQKTFWCRELQKNGIELAADSSVLVFYSKEFKLLQFMTGRFRKGQSFAAIRRKGELNGTFRSLMFSLGAFLLPFIFFYRILSAVLPKKRFLKEFLVSLPLTVSAISFWSAGEFCGYLTGRRKNRIKVKRDE